MAIAVGLNYQYSFKILKKYNDFAEEGITNLKKKKVLHMIEKKTFIKRETISGTNCSTQKKTTR